jgi:hypothetical protein
MFWRAWRRQQAPDRLSQRALVALVAAYLGRKPSDAELVEDVVRELEQRAGVGERAA